MKACRIALGWFCVLLLFLNLLSPLAQHAIDRHMGFWMLWGFYEILLFLGAAALLWPARASARATKWHARLRLAGGGVITLFGCLMPIPFESEGLVLCALFLVVGLWLIFSTLRAERRRASSNQGIGNQ